MPVRPPRPLANPVGGEAGVAGGGRPSAASYGVAVDDRLIATAWRWTFGRVLALDSGLARWCSLSLNAWVPSAAPDHGRSVSRASGCSFC